MPEPIKPYQEFVDKNYNPNSKLDWRPESWLGERAESVTGPKYTEEDVRIFRSHVPEYKKIEREARKNGTWLQMPDGTTWTGDPREWVMMQSEAFKKNYQENPWYTGQAEWATKVTLPDGTTVNTDKVKRARYHNGEMWFSNDAGYAQYFADAVGEGGVGRRNENYETSDVRGKVFLSAIPKKGNYRYLHNDSKGDLWWDMPYELTDNDIVRSKKIGKSKNDKWVIKSEGLNLKTDDIVNHSKKLGDDGIFMFNVMDGPVRRNIGNLPYYAVPNTGINEEMDPEGPSNSMHLEIPVNEFISQPGFTEKIKFIRGNNGNFDPNTDDKYSAIFKIDSPLFAKKGGRIHIKKKNRGKFTEYCGGKVTEECIARGKRSKNPLTRRRANFASVVRKWKHENGGILKAQNSAKLPGYVQYNGSDLFDIETFNKNWLNYRNSQLANQGWKDESIKNKLNWFQRNFGASDKTVANLVREQLFSNLDNTKELSFSDALKDSQGRYLLTESMYADFPGERKLHEVEVGPPKPIEDWKLDYSFNGSVKGTQYPDFNTIIYNDLYQNTPTKIHERDHAMFGQYNDKNIGLKIVDNIFKQEFLDNVVDKWGYYDEPSEIRARLMQMRYNNQLDPKHKYTLEEIENMRNNPTFIDEHIFDRYTNKYIEYLLNDVAQNNMNENRLDYRSPINFAKDGGILKAQEGTGNNFWSKLWNAVKEGGMAARDAKLGAIGAQQVRDLYSEGKNQEAQDLAKQYAKANTTGIALAGGAASTGLLGDLMVTGATTAADTFIDGDTENFGKNLSLNAAFDLVGHGVGKLLRNVDWGKVRNSVELIPDNTKADVSEYINTVDDALPERQPLTISKSKQFWDGTSESKLTDAEKAGVPKGERNQPVKVKTYYERDIIPLLSAEYTQRFEAPPLDPDYLETSSWQRAKYQRLMNDKFENIFDNTKDFNKTLQSYIDGLPNEIDPRFTSTTDGEIIQPSIAVRGYRNYLLNNGVDAVDISDDDLARLLTQEYKNLSNTATGKLKNTLLWHGSPTQFESFDFSKTSANTGNSGALGPGNYFSTHGGRYGHARSKIDNSLEMNNFQPYIVSNITSTPAGHDMIEKGLLPKFIDSYAMRSAKNQAILQKLISEIPTNDNRAYIDFTEAVNGYFNGPRAGIMIRRNTGIKSLYPHPSRFVRNADGTVTLIPTDWNDTRVNFKEGGKL